MHFTLWLMKCLLERLLRILQIMIFEILAKLDLCAFKTGGVSKGCVFYWHHYFNSFHSLAMFIVLKAIIGFGVGPRRVEVSLYVFFDFLKFLIKPNVTLYLVFCFWDLTAKILKTIWLLDCLFSKVILYLQQWWVGIEYRSNMDWNLTR